MERSFEQWLVLLEASNDEVRASVLSGLTKSDPALAALLRAYLNKNKKTKKQKSVV